MSDSIYSVTADKKVFGVPLSNIIPRNNHQSEQGSNYRNFNDIPGIPTIVVRCKKYLEAHLGLEGIFRISGSAETIDKLKEEWDSGILRITCRIFRF
jgi:hypothetical protein